VRGATTPLSLTVSPRTKRSSSVAKRSAKADRSFATKDVDVVVIAGSLQSVSRRVSGSEANPQFKNEFRIYAETGRCRQLACMLD